MTRRLRLPERKWTVVQCDDGEEYLIPFGFEGDTELNCPRLPIRELAGAASATRRTPWSERHDAAPADSAETSGVAGA